MSSDLECVLGEFSAWKTLVLHNYSSRMYSRRMMKIHYGPKNGFHAFGYNSAEIEPISMKFGTWWAKCWGLALADFWRDPHSSDSL